MKRLSSDAEEKEVRMSTSPIPAVSVKWRGERERRQKSSCEREVG